MDKLKKYLSGKTTSPWGEDAVNTADQKETEDATEEDGGHRESHIGDPVGKLVLLSERGVDVPQHHGQLEEVGDHRHLDRVRVGPGRHLLYLAPLLVLDEGDERVLVSGTSVLSEHSVLHTETRHSSAQLSSQSQGGTHWKMVGSAVTMNLPDSPGLVVTST